MADTKITALAAIATVDPAADVLPIVDISDTSMAASGTTKKVTSNQILGAGGIATLASATITGDLTVDTSTLKVDSGANKVGIGTTTMNGVLTVKNPNVAVESSIYAIQAATSTSQLSSWTIDQNTDVVSFGTDYAGALSLKTNSVERCNISSAGNVNISTGNVIIGTSGKGIDFSATASGSGTMTSELLNDYEEGTFTPTVLGATTAGTATYSGRAGYYTKIGRLVTVNIYLDWNSATGTGQMRLGGLPFTSSSSSLSFSSATFGLVSGIALTANHILTGYTETNNTVISALSYPAGGGTYAAVPLDAAGELTITCTYMAA